MKLPFTEGAPGIREDALLRKRLTNEGARQKIYRQAEEALSRWDKYLATEAGSAATDLAGLALRRIQGLLLQRSSDLAQIYQVPLQNVDEIRAELRGMARVWELLMSEPGRLRRVMEGKEDVAGAVEGGAEWEPLPKKVKDSV
jgi:hypothetical protein